MFNYFSLLILNFFDYLHKKKILKFFKKKKKILYFKTFFDVGAHKGESIEFFLQNFAIQTIYSFEASKDNYKKCVNNINSKNYKNTKIFIENLALGENSKTKFLLETSESSSSTINKINKKSKYYKKKNYFLNLKNEKKTRITQIKLSDYIKKHKITSFELIKIDTEGYEYFVLLGAEKFLKKFKYILFEHHYDDMIQKKYKFSDINSLLKDNGFKQELKLKMPFRKTFEYIYFNKNTI